MNAVPQYDSLAFAENAFKLRTYRQQVLGNNLANSDTPGFKARDIQFGDVLKAQLEGKATSSAIGLETTHAAHIPGKMPQDDPRLLYRIPNQPSMDGNTVDADIELTEFTKNSVLTEFAINRFGSTIKSRMSAITGQPS
jgi:flagellar basal-body rod protein FlgB